MKNKKTNEANILRLLGIIALAAVIGFSTTSCSIIPDDDGGHTHSWSVWKTNATQHWKECDCGEEYGRASHTGTPCSVCGFTTASVNLSLDGVWRHVSNTDPNNYEEVTISGNTGVLTHVGNYGAGTLSQSAVDKGYLKVGIQWFRNLIKTGDLTWTGQKFGITWNDSAPNVATGTGWMNFTITMAANGQTFTEGGGATWTRQ
jgi:hypothetical protein